MQSWNKSFKDSDPKGTESILGVTATPQKIKGFEGKKVVALNAGKDFVSVFTGLFFYMFWVHFCL